MLSQIVAPGSGRQWTPEPKSESSTPVNRVKKDRLAESKVPVSGPSLVSQPFGLAGMLASGFRASQTEEERMESDLLKELHRAFDIEYSKDGFLLQVNIKTGVFHGLFHGEQPRQIIGTYGGALRSEWHNMSNLTEYLESAVNMSEERVKRIQKMRGEVYRNLFISEACQLEKYVLTADGKLFIRAKSVGLPGRNYKPRIYTLTNSWFLRRAEGSQPEVVKTCPRRHRYSSHERWTRGSSWAQPACAGSSLRTR